MEGSCSTGQSPQWAVVPMEEEEELCRKCGPGSSVGIATGYGLDGPGIESR
jgi:hypothetical protein